MLVNCRNFKCKFNNKGECRLEKITLQDDGSPIISKLICIEAEEMSKDAKPLDLETAWGEPESEQPQQPKKDYFDVKGEGVPE